MQETHATGQLSLCTTVKSLCAATESSLHVLHLEKASAKGPSRNTKTEAV